MTRLLALLTACSLALTIAACGGDDSSDGSGGGSSASTTQQKSDTGAAKPAPSGKTVTVDIKDIKFLPHDVTVKAGTTVKWTNSDGFAHTVTKTGGPGAQFDSGNVEGGSTYEQTFTAKGKIDYVCTIHQGQSGTITVQ